MDTTRTQLEATDRQDTVAGAVALVLAARIDSGRDTGASLAALAREYRATLLWALEGITPEADALDELRRRREVRAARATGRRP